MPPVCSHAPTTHPGGTHPPIHSGFAEATRRKSERRVTPVLPERHTENPFERSTTNTARKVAARARGQEGHPGRDPGGARRA